MTDFSLAASPRTYYLSYQEALVSCLTGFTAIPYAKRHFDLATSNNILSTYSLVHRIIGIAECIPILGAIAGLIDALATRIFLEHWKRRHQLNDGKEYIHSYMGITAPDLTAIKAPHHAQRPNTHNQKTHQKKNLSKEDRAALVLQTRWRGIRAKKKLQKVAQMHFLKPAVRLQVKAYLQDPKVRAKKAVDGMTAVFFPEPLPDIILKISGGNSYSRLWHMAVFRNLCEKEQYSHLAIPKASLYRERGCDQLLIEERLPLSVRTLDQLKMYHEHWKEFSPAISEFSGFIMQTGIHDLVGSAPCYKWHEPRSDNFPLFIDETGKHKVALIDLEEAKLEGGPHFDELRRLVYLFPYHYDVIINQAKRLGCTQEILATAQPDLQRAWELGCAFIKFRYIDFVKYAEQKDKNRNRLQVSSSELAQIADEIQREESYKPAAKPLLKNYFARVLTQLNKACQENTFDVSIPERCAHLESYLLKGGAPSLENLVEGGLSTERFDVSLFLSKLVVKGHIYSFDISIYTNRCGIMF